MEYATVNRFRSKRGKVLRRHIDALSRRLGRKIVVLDIGGRADYWANVGTEGIARIEILNYRAKELRRKLPQHVPETLFEYRQGDARELSEFADGSVDLIHSNSVIEHVGGWNDMARMAGEAMRVGRAGWIQTPAWEFPVEPHFQVPFMHWFARPMQARMMRFVVDRRHRRNDLKERRRRIERVNLLSRREVETLFPGREIYVERLVFPKSYTVHWLPDGGPG